MSRADDRPLVVVQEGALADGHRPTDVGNADRFVAVVDGKARFVPAWAKWIVYIDGRWPIDASEALVTELAKDVARHLFRQAADLTGPARDDLWAWARRCEAARSISAMIRLARGVDGVHVDHHELDADPWVFNVTNGTIDLRTGALRRHNPDDLLTLQAPVWFDPDADAPLWRACLERWQPDPDVRAFLQRAVGSGLTGHPVEALIVNVGSGGNGKTKFFGAVANVLGPYCVVPHKSLLVAQRHEQHATVLASLFRARLLIAPETSKNDRLDEEMVKNLTGGDQLRARRMREDEWSFTPTHTAFIHSNHKPRIKGTDEGVWRRVHLVPWAVTIPPAERDEHLAAKLAAEAPGILNWLLAGALEWQQRGLDPPNRVRAATEEYRTDEDHLGRFLAESCTVGDSLSVPASTLRAAYESWCGEVGEQPWSAKSLGSELSSRGYDSVKGGRTNTRRWIGLDVNGATP